MHKTRRERDGKRRLTSKLACLFPFEWLRLLSRSITKPVRQDFWREKTLEVYREHLRRWPDPRLFIQESRGTPVRPIRCRLKTWLNSFYCHVCFFCISVSAMHDGTYCWVSAHWLHITFRDESWVTWTPLYRVEHFSLNIRTACSTLYNM